MIVERKRHEKTDEMVGFFDKFHFRWLEITVIEIGKAA